MAQELVLIPKVKYEHLNKIYNSTESKYSVPESTNSDKKDENEVGNHEQKKTENEIKGNQKQNISKVKKGSKAQSVFSDQKQSKNSEKVLYVKQKFNYLFPNQLKERKKVKKDQQLRRIKENSQITRQKNFPTDNEKQNKQKWIQYHI